MNRKITTNFDPFTEALYGTGTDKLKARQDKINKAKRTRAKNRALGNDESSLQRQCVKWFDLQYPDLYFSLFAVPNGGSRNVREATKFKREGVRAGVSDLILAYNGIATFIELKRPDGKGTQTADQKEFEQHITSQGFDYHLIDTFEDFQELIRNIIN